MGKLFAIVVTVITLISVAFFVMHTWWLPTDISTTGLAIDHQLDETFVETGILFLAGQLLLGLFVWQASDKNPARKIKIFPGGSTPSGRGRDHCGRASRFWLSPFWARRLGLRLTMCQPLPIPCTLTYRPNSLPFGSAIRVRTASLVPSIPK